MEVLTIVSNISAQALEQVCLSKTFYRFTLEMVLLCPTKAIRFAASEQFLAMAMQAAPSTMLQYLLDLHFAVLQNNTVREYARTSHEFFQLLCRLLNFATTSNSPIPAAESLILNEISWLQKARVSR